MAYLSQKLYFVLLVLLFFNLDIYGECSHKNKEDGSAVLYDLKVTQITQMLFIVVMFKIIEDGRAVLFIFM